jgi:hypothetical protein
MRYNKHFANHFSSCRLLATGHDPHRNRDVQVRQLPGEFDVVGVTDGVDAWVAPITVAPSPLFDRVRKAFADIRAGLSPKVTESESPKVHRRPLTLPPPASQQQPQQPEARIRRRVVSS